MITDLGVRWITKKNKNQISPQRRRGTEKKYNEKNLDYVYSLTKLFMFKHSIIKNLSEKEARVLYQQKCYRKCHGDEVIKMVLLPPAGWIEVVDRMRAEKGVEMTSKEADVITNYLKETYPVPQSNLPY